MTKLNHEVYKIKKIQFIKATIACNDPLVIRYHS